MNERKKERKCAKKLIIHMTGTLIYMKNALKSGRKFSTNEFLATQAKS